MEAIPIYRVGVGAWLCFPHCWAFVSGIRPSAVFSIAKDHRCKALVLLLLLVRTDCWLNSQIAGDLRHYSFIWRRLYTMTLQWLQCNAQLPNSYIKTGHFMQLCDAEWRLRYLSTLVELVSVSKPTWSSYNNQCWRFINTVCRSSPKVILPEILKITMIRI